MSYQRWMRCVVLSSALVAMPLQSALASGAQWRPGKSLAPSGQHPMVRMQRGDVHARFRPVDQRSRQALQAAQRYVPPAPPVHLPKPPQLQAPAFARQFAWRPAANPWSPHGESTHQAQQRPRTAAVQARQPFAGDSHWRPVPGAFVPAGAPVQRQTPRNVPQFVRAEPGWRPSQVQTKQAPAKADRQFVYRPVEQQPVVAQQPRAPRTPRYPAYVQPRMPGAPMAGYYMPLPRPAYPAPMPYPVAQQPWQPYVAAPPMMMPPMPMPPQPMWGWAGPAYGYGAPASRYGWPAQPVARESYLAGCPDC